MARLGDPLSRHPTSRARAGRRHDAEPRRQGRGQAGRGARTGALGRPAAIAGRRSPRILATARVSTFRTHSRVTPSRLPTSLRVIGISPSSPNRMREDSTLASVEPLETPHQVATLVGGLEIRVGSLGVAPLASSGDQSPPSSPPPLSSRADVPAAPSRPGSSASPSAPAPRPPGRRSAHIRIPAQSPLGATPLRQQPNHVRRQPDRRRRGDQPVPDRLLDPVARIGAESGAVRGIVLLGGGEQPQVPSPIRSSSSRPRPRKSLAMATTSRRLARTSRS